MFRNAKIYDDPVQIIKTGRTIAKIRTDDQKSNIYTEFAMPGPVCDKKAVLCASRTEAKNLYLGAYDSKRKIFVFRRVAGIYEPKACYDRDAEDENLKEYDIVSGRSFFDCVNEDVNTGDESESVNEKNGVLMDYFYLYKMLKRLVVVNTREFVDAASYNSKIDKMTIITFLNDNTIKFKGRKILDHNFYDEYLRDKRRRMLEAYDTVDADKMKQLLGDSFFLYEELHVEKNYTYKLKGYDEKVEEQEPPVQSDYKSELIDITMQKYKMVSVEDIMKNTLLSYHQVRQILAQRNYVKLCNEKYAPLHGEHQPVRNQVLDILKQRDKIKKKELTYDDESHFKAVIKEFCTFERGVWQLKR